MAIDPIFYNQASSKLLGWDPTWFGLDFDQFDEELIKRIKVFQRDHQLDDDGLCGEMTWRRKLTEMEANFALLEDKVSATSGNEIIVAGKSVKIEWNKVKSLGHKGALILEPGRRRGSNKADLSQFVLHHDAALSAPSCYNILKKRGLSVHFSIDNDGTIYQFTDANDVCWHAKGINFKSIGVEISNAVETKYQGHYVRQGLPKRPVLKDVIHGRTYIGMGYYPEQIAALKELIKVICKEYNIPIRVPVNDDGNLLKETYKLAQDGSWRGVVAHYHHSENKWDPFGLDLKQLVDEINDE